MTRYACLQCGEEFPGVVSHVCPECGGVFSIPKGINYRIENLEPSLPGIWRYRRSFGLPASAPVLTLGEGNTPLVSVDLEDAAVWLKMESANPTGSYKDRLAAVLVSALAGAGVTRAVEDSSGNAGAAFAAYCGRAGIHSKVFVPASAAGPKRNQITRFGAEVVEVPGLRQAAVNAVLAEVARGEVYASHAYLPQGLAGVATIAYELVEELGAAPGMLIAPIGHGGLMLGIILGFEALQAAGEIDQLPRFIGVQAQQNAPIWAAANQKWFTPGSTVADGIAVSSPVRGPELLALYRSGIIDFVSVPDEKIIAGKQTLARQGIDAELTSAVIVDAYRQIVDLGHLPAEGDVVAILSGHGLKQ